MSLVLCPECKRSISDKAEFCPACGYPFGTSGPAKGRRFYEYTSRTRLFGLPLLHIVAGPDRTGRIGIAKGIIAVGNIAIGVLSVGGFAAGVISIGGFCFGLVSLGGLSIGFLLAIGGFALGYASLGGVAIGVYALGGLVVGIHTVYSDPGLAERTRDIIQKAIESYRKGDVF